MSNVDTVQHGGSHYKTEYQHWNLLPNLGFGPEYYIANATKYLTRHAKKNGREDVQKAMHYAEKLVVLCSEGSVHPRQWPDILRPTILGELERYAIANNLDVNGDEMKATMYLTLGTQTHHYSKAAGLIHRILARYDSEDTVAVPPPQTEVPVVPRPPSPVPPPAVPTPTTPTAPATPAGTPLSHDDVPVAPKPQADVDVPGLPPAAYTAINPQFQAEGFWGDATVLWKCKPCGVYFKTADGAPPWKDHKCAKTIDASMPTREYVDQDR